MKLVLLLTFFSASALMAMAEPRYSDYCGHRAKPPAGSLFVCGHATPSVSGYESGTVEAGWSDQNFLVLFNSVKDRFSMTNDNGSISMVASPKKGCVRVTGDIPGRTVDVCNGKPFIQF